MGDHSGIRRLTGLLSGLVLSSTTFMLIPTAAAMVGSTEPCVASNGQDLATTYDTSLSIVSPDCNQVHAGQRWSPSVPLVMNARFETVPEWFKSDSASPLEDLRRKLKSVTYVVDPDYEPLAFKRSYPVRDNLWVGELPEAPGQPAGLPVVNTLSVGSLDPLPAGRHYIEIHWDLAAPFCDGLAAHVAANCLPAGDSLVRRMHFYVVAT